MAEGNMNVHRTLLFVERKVLPILKKYPLMADGGAGKFCAARHVEFCFLSSC
ncbi:MAG: hypothetical protein PHI63_01075 [Patescibacteria group bacterium]|nr:hypothetical protein [Patescibacteria group bacterium]